MSNSKDNAVKLAGIPDDQLTELTNLLGLEPIFGAPQVTETFVYQCVRNKTPLGVKVFFRTWPILHRLKVPKFEDIWVSTIFISCFSTDESNIQHPTMPDKDWLQAKAELENKKLIKKWRGDDEAARYYSAHWNVYGFLQQDAIGWLYGAPGSYKTVLAMDIACSVSTGRPWAKRATRKGAVLYISAEGGGGIYAMRDAWERKNDARCDHLSIYVGSPDISAVSIFGSSDDCSGKRDYDPLISMLKELENALGQPVSLIVIDTYAQTSPDDTKAAVTAYEKSIRALIRKVAPGASVLVIDHTTKEGTTWMGSNAKLGNMDMMGLVKKTGDDVVLTMRNGKGKLKNAVSFEDIRMTPRLVALGWDDPQGNSASAPVLEYCATALTEREAIALNLVGDKTTYGDLRKTWHGHEKLASVAATTRKTALSRAIRGLREKDSIDVEGLEYDQTDDGAKERPITDTCVIFPM
jgi:hypothetical protein